MVGCKLFNLAYHARRPVHLIAIIFPNCGRSQNDSLYCARRQGLAINYPDLYDLIGKKNTDTVISNLWTKLGSDYTFIEWGADVFYVIYQSQGLSFKFEEDTSSDQKNSFGLSDVIMLDNYKGRLPYDLQFCDSLTSVKAILGAPSATFSYGHVLSLEYKDRGLWIEGDTGKISRFILSKRR